MQVEFINPFVESSINTFDTMLGQRLKRTSLQVKDKGFGALPVQAVIGISGNVVGTAVLGMTSEIACMAAAKMLMVDEIKEVNDDVVDAVGELLNIITGGAKARLNNGDYALGLLLSTVVVGKGDIRFPSEVQPVVIGFECEWGEVTIEVGFVHTPE